MRHVLCLVILITIIKISFLTGCASVQEKQALSALRAAAPELAADHAGALPLPVLSEASALDDYIIYRLHY